jgi:radical SAM superfamily enzyme YgiQ (UPF0313 family)
MANFLFVNPSTHRFKGATSVALTMPPLGLAGLAAMVESRGHKAQIIDANLLRLDPEDIASRVTDRPDMIGMTVNILSIKMALEYGELLKKAFPAARLVLGGPHASVTGSRILEKHPWVDAIVVGEGEMTMAEIADRAGQKELFHGILGVIFRRGQEIIDNGQRPLIADIDTLPRPAYHLLPDLSRYRSRSRAFPVGYIFTSRGCPAACTFCYRNFGTQWRPRSPENVLAEIGFLRETYGIRQLDILDDNFTFDGARAARILEMIIEKRWDLKINLQIGVRVHSLTPELLKTMKRAGVFKFGFGVESGDEAMLKRIKKGLQLERAVELVRNARSLGLITHGYYIIGFPGDTPESMQRTIDFARRLDSHYASFSICTPLPGTEVYDDIARHGEFIENLLDGIDEGLFSLKGFFRYGDLTPESAAAYCEKAWKDFYARPGKVLDVLGTVRSWGEFLWLLRVVGDMFRSKKR